MSKKGDRSLIGVYTSYDLNSSLPTQPGRTRVRPRMRGRRKHRRRTGKWGCSAEELRPASKRQTRLDLPSQVSVAFPGRPNLHTWGQNDGGGVFWLHLHRLWPCYRSVPVHYRPGTATGHFPHSWVRTCKNTLSYDPRQNRLVDSWKKATWLLVPGH